MAEAKPPTAYAVAAARKKDVYYPFRDGIFRHSKHPEQYKGLKYKNMGIVRGLHWRKGFPDTKIGRFAGTFRPSGRKNKKHQTRHKVKMAARRVCHRMPTRYLSVYPATLSSPFPFAFDVIIKRQRRWRGPSCRMSFERLWAGHRTRNGVWN